MTDRTVYSSTQFQRLIDEEYNKLLTKTSWAEEFAMDTDAYYTVQDSMFPFRGDQVTQGDDPVYAAVGTLEALRDISRQYQVKGLYVHEMVPDDVPEAIRVINSMTIEDLYLRLHEDSGEARGMFRDMSLSGLKRYRSYELECNTPVDVLKNSADTLTHFRWDPSDLSDLSKPKWWRVFKEHEMHWMKDKEPMDYSLRAVRYVKIPSSAFVIDDYGDKIEYLDISTHSRTNVQVELASSGLFHKSWYEKFQNLTTVYAGWVSKIGFQRLLSYPKMVTVHVKLLGTITLPVRTVVSPLRSLRVHFWSIMRSATTPKFTIPNNLYESLEDLSLDVGTVVGSEEGVYEEYVLSKIRFRDFKVLHSLYTATDYQID